MKYESPMRGSVVSSEPNCAEDGGLVGRRAGTERQARGQGHEWELPARLESSGAARRLARKVLEEWHVPPSDVVSVVAELVGNALVHADGPIHMGLYREGAIVRVEVSDQGGTGGGRPHVRAPAQEGVTGRGLWMVKALSRDWGVIFSGGSAKTVWAEVPDELIDTSAIRAGGAPGSAR